MSDYRLCPIIGYLLHMAKYSPFHKIQRLHSIYYRQVTENDREHWLISSLYIRYIKENTSNKKKTELIVSFYLTSLAVLNSFSVSLFLTLESTMLTEQSCQKYTCNIMYVHTLQIQVSIIAIPW